jgi:hypothetical protein
MISRKEKHKHRGVEWGVGKRWKTLEEKEIMNVQTMGWGKERQREKETKRSLKKKA